MIGRKHWSKDTKAYIKNLVKEIGEENIKPSTEEQINYVGDLHNLYLTALKDVEENGLTQTGRNGEVKTSSSALLVLRTQQLIVNNLKELMLTTRSKLKIKEVEGETESPLLTFLNGGEE